MTDDRAFRVLPVEGRFFDDTIDGYFRLQDSLRQMLGRNGFGSAIVSLLHAPVMDLPKVAPDAPVPLRIGHERAGMIRRMRLVATLDGPDLRLCGAARWSWLGEGAGAEAAFDPGWRLAEPAYVQGIGLPPGEVETAAFGRLARGGPDSPFAVGCPGQGAPPPDDAQGRWARSRLWGVGAQAILPEDRVPDAVVFGVPWEAGGAQPKVPADMECLFVDVTDGAVAQAAARLHRER